MARAAPEPEDYKEALGKRIRAARRALGLSQRDLAPLIGANDNMQISRWERGERTPEDPRALARLATLSGASLAWLILGNEGEPPSLTEWLGQREQDGVTEIERAWLRGVPVVGDPHASFWEAVLAARRVHLTPAEAAHHALVKADEQSARER